MANIKKPKTKIINPQRLVDCKHCINKIKKYKLIMEKKNEN